MHKKEKNILIYIFSILIIIILFLLSNKYYKSKIDYQLYNLIYPILKFNHYIVLKLSKLNFAQLKYCKNSDIKYYLDTIENLNKKIIELESSIDYINNIQPLLDFKKRYNINSVECNIIFKNLDNKQQFIIIDKGSNDNILENMIAIYKNSIVGKVSEVYKYCSKVILITDKRIKISAYCIESKLDCLYEGINNKDIGYISFVDNIDKIKNGELVISSGKGSVYPRGFAIGQIESIKNIGVDSLIVIKPLLDIKSIEYCSLISNKVNFNDFKDLN